MATFPAAHASLTRSDSIDLPAGITTEHRGRTLTLASVWFRLYTGYASDGHQTNYQRRHVQWLEVESRQPDGRIARRVCSRYAGRNLPNAERDYDRALTEFATRYPGQPATFPTTAAA